MLIQPRSIQRNGLSPVDFLVEWRLVVATQDEVAEYQHVDAGAHEAGVGLCRCTDDGFTAHVERGIDQHRAAGLLLEGAQQRGEQTVCFVTEAAATPDDDFFEESVIIIGCAVGPSDDLEWN